MASNIQQQIDLITEELKQLRLPHKLKQYRHYEKCLEQLKSTLSDDEESSATLIEQIDQLFVKLDKSVICGVDQCFLCGNNDNNRNNSSKTFHHHMDKQKQSIPINDHNNNHVDNDDQLNDSDRLLQTTRAKLRNTSSSSSTPIKAIVIETKKSDNIIQTKSESDQNKIDDVEKNGEINNDDALVTIKDPSNNEIENNEIKETNQTHDSNHAVENGGQKSIQIIDDEHGETTDNKTMAKVMKKGK
ncbi:hypothetical protein BLA29_007750 [Euroglyphus maynei]|uniref:Uncharacterized protein n=1 Tax=Euroglyphus maynei TaxID=6958 RepID=A0A1Y3BF30_EURMA|nr:hypothetical protein BLA29_007750 [Euroglyphus maynei]